MNYSTYRFTLDIHQSRSQVSIPVMFQDTWVQLYVNLTDGGKPFKIEEGCMAVLYGKKADGTALVNECEIIDNNTRIVYTFNEQTASCIGSVGCEIRLYSKDGLQLTTPSFFILVEERVIKDDEIVESETALTALDQLFESEAVRQYAEAGRKNSEDARVESEDARQVAETSRQESETARAEAEAARVEAESAREVEEAKRRDLSQEMKAQMEQADEYLDGFSGVYTLADGETLADAPEHADVVIDPKGEAVDLEALRDSVNDLDDELNKEDEAIKARLGIVEEKLANVTNVMDFVGVSTTDPLGSNGATVSGVASFNKGDVVAYGNKEYVYDGSVWREYGDTTALAASVTQLTDRVTADEKALADYKAKTDAEITEAKNEAYRATANVASLNSTVATSIPSLTKNVATAQKTIDDYKSAHANDYTNEQIDEMLAGAGGGSVNTDDLEGVLRYTEQTLTDEEKAQARANIGAADPALVEDTAVGVGMYMMGTLKWDGSIGDRHSVTISEGDGMSIKFVRVSEEVPQSDMAYSCSFATFGGMLGISGGKLEFQGDGGVMMGNLEGAPAVLVVLDDNIELANGVYLKKGIYFEAMCFDIVEGLPSIPAAFISSLYLLGHEFKTATTNSLFDEIMSSDTVTHDGVVKGEYVEEYENEGDAKPIYWVKVSDAVPTIADLTDKTLSMSVVRDGETLTDDIPPPYVSVADNGVIFIALAVAIIPTDNFNAGGITFPSRGVYFANNNIDYYVSRLTIPGYNDFDSDPKIKEEYLPDNIQRVGDDVIINSSTEGSNKRFKITVDDSGTITATEVT